MRPASASCGQVWGGTCPACGKRTASRRGGYSRACGSCRLSGTDGQHAPRSGVRTTLSLAMLASTVHDAMILEERSELRSWLGDPPRHPDQPHGIYESDAEIVRLHDGCFLAVSVDAVAEEIAAGLFEDPYTMGWVTAMTGLADIAAVGADPVGVLMTAVWDESRTVADRARAADGFADALRVTGTTLLGGDTGGSGCTMLAATAIGRTADPPLMRVGASAGDILCLTGRVGAGMTLAARMLLGEERQEELYRPRARIAEGARLRRLASACTDASDGVLQGVGTLTTLNGLGASLEWNPRTLDDRAAAYLRDKELPLWPLWISEIAELELLAAIPECNLAEALAAVPSLNPIGRLTEATGMTVSVDGRTIPVDPHGLPSFAKVEDGSRLQQALDVLADIRELGLP